MNHSDAALWLLLQLADSGFPTGAFAHSGGLEALSAFGEMNEPFALQRFLEGALWQAGYTALPVLRSCHENTSLHHVRTMADWTHVSLTNAVANRASRVQGRSFVAACARAFPRKELLELDEACRSQGLWTHQAPLMGAVLGRLGLPLEESLCLYLHQTLRGVLSAGVRLGLLGPLEAQRVHGGVGTLLDEILRSTQSLGPYDLAQPAPLLDFFGSLHDQLYSRLFQS